MPNIYYMNASFKFTPSFPISIYYNLIKEPTRYFSNAQFNRHNYQRSKDIFMYIYDTYYSNYNCKI